MFELGYMLYFLLFIIGLLVLLAVSIYLLRELFLQKQTWSERSGGSKAMLLCCALIAISLLLIPLHQLYLTRASAIVGRFEAEGTWGTSKLLLKDDGTLTEQWHFTNEYNGKFEGDGQTTGTWKDVGRDWLTRDISLSPFTPLGESERGKQYSTAIVSVRGYGGLTSIEVDAGRDIVYFKR